MVHHTFAARKLVLTFRPTTVFMKNLPPLARQSLDLHMFNISIGHTEFTAMESKTAATPKGFLIFRHVYVMAENSDYESLHLLINYQRRVYTPVGSLCLQCRLCTRSWTPYWASSFNLERSRKSPDAMPCPERRSLRGPQEEVCLTQMSCWMRSGISCIEMQQECTSILDYLSRIHLSQFYAMLNDLQAYTCLECLQL